MPRDSKKSTEQPRRAPTGLPQGEHKALMDQQAAIPLPNAQGRMSNAIASAESQASPIPTNLLGRPTSDRPTEPVTTGILGGGTPGPEAIAPIIKPVDQDLAGMVRWLPVLETLADDEGSSNAMRSFVRRLRGAMPTAIRQAAQATNEQKQK
jgi:hypothetical protein